MTWDIKSGVTAEQVCAALRAMGTEVPDGNPDELPRAELLGQLLAATEGALALEADSVALDAARRGCLEAVVSRVKGLSVPEAEVDMVVQELWVRSIELRVRRASYDWNFLSQRLPEVFGQHHGAAVVASLLSAATELFEPYYPKRQEPVREHMVRFREALARAGSRMAAGNRGLGAARRVLKSRGIAV